MRCLMRSSFIALMRHSELGGIRYGHGIKRITSLTGTTFGVLVLWHRDKPAQYEMREIRPDMMVNLLRVCGASWPQTYFLLFYFFVGVFSEPTYPHSDRPFGGTLSNLMPYG